MNIGIIGSGHIGGTLARLFVEAGHEVYLSNSRGPESLQAVVRELGPRAHAVTPEEAARRGDVVVEAIPFGRLDSLPAGALAGKILISASNYYPQRDGQIDLGGLSQTEFLARSVPGATVVKAFNTIFWEHLRDQGDAGRELPARRAIFVAGDDPNAKATIFNLILDIGFAPVDTGNLHDGGKAQEPGTPIYNQALTAEQAREMVNTEQD